MKKYNINEELQKRILVLDGAMGTMIQQHSLHEDDFRGEILTHHCCDVKGNNDLLVLTMPQVIEDIHRKYLEAGADIIETNTFNAQKISMADYHVENLVMEMNIRAAQIARKVCDEFTQKNPEKPRFVAGSIGPTNKTLSLSPDINKPEKRAISYNEVKDAYYEQVCGLIDGGVDVILVETIFDTLNAKACLFAIEEAFEYKKISLPVMLSLTVSDQSGRSLSGQTVEAFWISVSHFPLLSVGLNCAMGAEMMRPFLEEISKIASCNVSVYPNAGLPNQFGGYDEAPKQMAEVLKSFANQGLVNIVGGCCGTSPAHISEFAKAVENVNPRQISAKKTDLQLAGLEPITINKETNFVNIGERTNVAGSKKFANLIRDKKYEEALSVARQQIENGAQVIDINLDDGMLDAKKEMELFVRMLSSDPEIARVPIMPDSSEFEVLEIALQNWQGKALVNSISLKNGEQDFLEKANLIKKYGAAVIVMAFDETGQAVTFEQKIKVCQRAYNLLVNNGFNPSDIVFDCNILTVGTGIFEHNNFAVDFIKAVEWVKQNLPYCKTSGGVSNLSFAFRGNDKLRETIHAIFLYHAINAGLDMGIVNAGALPVYDEIDKDFLKLCEDLILNKRKDATERLLTYAQNLQEDKITETAILEWRQLPIKERLIHSLYKGITDFAEEDINDAIKTYSKAIDIIEGPLMDGMNYVGTLFGSGRMFLPQVMKSARVMKKMVTQLQPIVEEQNSSNEVIQKAGKILLATVKGDVHDIGKNIVAVVLACNNYEIIDLGIMVTKETILDEAEKHNVDIIGLSGLITPSLEEMVQVAKEIERRGKNYSLLIGGATTSKLHTAVKIANSFNGNVVYVKDASKAVNVASTILNNATKQDFLNKIKSEYTQIAKDYVKSQSDKILLNIEEARKNKFIWKKEEAKIVKPSFLGTKTILDISIEKLIPYIDWTFFFHQWRLNGKYPAILKDPVKGTEANKLYWNALEILNELIVKKEIKTAASFGFYKAFSKDENVFIKDENNNILEFNFLRDLKKQENNEPNFCLADFIAPEIEEVEDYIGFFAVTAGLGVDEIHKNYIDANDDYNALMVRILADRLAEALTEYLHLVVRKNYWAYSTEENYSVEEMLEVKYQGIRPAPGYPACPVHSEKDKIFKLLDVTQNTNITLTENWSMLPAASVCGYYFAHPKSKYFSV